MNNISSNIPFIRLSSSLVVTEVSPEIDKVLVGTELEGTEAFLELLNMQLIIDSLQSSSRWAGWIKIGKAKTDRGIWVQGFSETENGGILLLLFPDYLEGYLGSAFNRHLVEITGSLLGKIGHDFNNYLGSITGCLDLIAHKISEYFKEENPFERALALVEKSLKNATEMTDRMRGCVRPEPMEAQSCELEGVIREAALKVQRYLPAEDSLEIKIDKAFEASVNPFQMEQVVKALFENSCQSLKKSEEKKIIATLRGTTEEERRSIPGDFSVLEISDTGSGMSAARMTRALVPFYSSKSSGIGTGFGLGLNMAQAVMRQVGGELLIDSEQDQGTRVRLFFSDRK